MCPNPHSRLIRGCVLVSILTVTPLAAATMRAAEGLPPAPSELDQEISITVQGQTLGQVFRILAEQTHLGLTIAFDPTTKVDLDVRNMSLRVVLESLAGSYGLDYAWNAQMHVLSVRQKDLPPKGPRGTVTITRQGPSSATQYRLAFLIRNAQGRVLSTPAVTTQLHQMLTIKQGWQAGGEDRMVKLTAVPVEDAGDTLRVSLDLATSAPVAKVTPGETRTLEDHRRVTKSLAHGQTILFKIDDGLEIVLRDWTRIEPKAK